MSDVVIMFFGAMTAVALEALYRTHDGGFEEIVVPVIPLAVFVTYAVYRTMHTSDSLLAGIVIWSFTVACLRMLTTLLILKEQPHPGAWLGFGLIILAQVVNKVWR